jgi:chromosome segregation protein
MDRGAHYFKTDLQVHTPRDKAWTGERPVTPEARAEYARQFVMACREKGLGAVAITDHHDFVLFPAIKDAAANEVDSEGEALPAERRLVVFPGLELTLAVPCQALLILDADFPVERLSGIFDLLAITAVDKAAPHSGDVQRVGHIETLKQLHEELDRNDWLKRHLRHLPERNG